MNLFSYMDRFLDLSQRAKLPRRRWHATERWPATAGGHCPGASAGAQAAPAGWGAAGPGPSEHEKMRCFWAFTSSNWGFHHGKAGKMVIEPWKMWENGDFHQRPFGKIGVQPAKILPELVKYLWFYQNTTRTDINQPISQRYRGLKFVV